MPYSRSKRFDANYHVVLNAAEDILSGMGFEVRYRNHRSGRLFCHGMRDRAGATVF